MEVSVLAQKKIEVKATNKQQGNKKCSCCGEEYRLVDFYLSYSPLYSQDQRVPICKNCIRRLVLNPDGTINHHKLKDILKSIDKPLYYDSLYSAEQSVKKEHSYFDNAQIQKHGAEILGQYFRLIAMRQDRAISYADSEKDKFMHHDSNRTSPEIRYIINRYSHLDDDTGRILEETEVAKQNENKFKVTPEMVKLFGDGYDETDYKKMFEKYETLKVNYTLQTNLHQEALATYVRFKVKEEDATARGDVDQAKKWYDAAQNAAANGKLTPKQLTEADLHGGINSFSELFKSVEQAIDVIPILPQFKFRPNDALDFIIWCYINYIRDLQGLPQCDYEDIYKFYDKKKQEYLEQYGDPYKMFEDDPTPKNRENIKKFITLPKDYEQ